MLAESAFQSASECMLLLHTCMKSTVKMHFLDTIHGNVVLSEPEQSGEIQLCQNMYDMSKYVKNFCIFD